MAKAYNRHITKTNLDPTQQNIFKTKLINIVSDKSKLLSELNDRFRSVCSGSEMCLTRQDFMNEIVHKEMYEDILHETFRSVGPKDPREWLATPDIDELMHKYEVVYPEFKFLGAVPSDCDKLDFCILNEFDFDAYLSKNITKLGIIFNHDIHGDPGSHWVSMFINIANGEVYYVDSVGKDPIGRIGEIIDKFRTHYKNRTGKSITYKKNKIPYQTDSSECGVYSCNFLIRLLYGETFEHIVKNALDFEEINSCRNIYFSNRPSKYKIHKLCDPGEKIN